MERERRGGETRGGESVPERQPPFPPGRRAAWRQTCAPGAPWRPSLPACSPWSSRCRLLPRWSRRAPRPSPCDVCALPRSAERWPVGPRLRTKRVFWGHAPRYEGNEMVQKSQGDRITREYKHIEVSAVSVCYFYLSLCLSVPFCFLYNRHQLTQLKMLLQFRGFSIVSLWYKLSLCTLSIEENPKLWPCVASFFIRK